MASEGRSGVHESIQVYPDSQRPGFWVCSIRHRNGGDIHSGIRSEKEAWEKARRIAEWHRLHPFDSSVQHVDPASSEEAG